MKYTKPTVEMLNQAHQAVLLAGSCDSNKDGDPFDGAGGCGSGAVHSDGAYSVDE